MINLSNITVSVPDKLLIHKSNLTLTYGSKYGLIGYNGTGKTTLLKYIYKKELEGIPKDLSIYYVGQEEEKVEQNKTIYQVVLEANKEKYDLVCRLNELDDMMAIKELGDKSMEEYDQINEKLDQLQYYKDEAIIRKILYGLGFEKDKQDTLYTYLSGGFKMRVSIAKGLYMNPTILMLDEIDNHLDLASVIWLTEYLKNKWKNTLLIISHNTNFLNEICTHIINLDNKELHYHTGNYDKFLITKNQELRTKEKEWKIIENKVKDMQRKSTKSEIVEEFLKQNEDKKPPKPYKVNIRFNKTSEIKDPLLNVNNLTFGYDKDHILFTGINFSLCNGDKYVLAGKNGVGKTTFLKLIAKKLVADVSSEICYNSRLRLSHYDQEFKDFVDCNLSPVQYIQQIDKNLNDQQARQLLGTIGLDGEHHLKPIKLLSGGQKARVQLVCLCVLKPHVLLLDEPSNNLDIEAIYSLIKAIKDFDGAMVIITHNIDLINNTECKVLLLEDNKLNTIDFNDYYEQILEEVDAFQ
jgi:ATPase subunit of ABC transporter with duplicated ATPase domains